MQGGYSVTDAGGAFVGDWNNAVANITVADGTTEATMGSTEPVQLTRSQLGNGLGFQAHLHDFVADLILMRARVFDPGVGQFLQPDPIGHEDSVNLYAGVGWDPVGYRDPTGTSKRDVLMIQIVFYWVLQRLTTEGRRLTKPYLNNYAYDVLGRSTVITAPRTTV